MKNRIFPLFILAFQSLAASSPERSVSPSRQFIVYGIDSSSRGMISELAERTKADALTLLRRVDGWKTPIVINLQLPQANLPEIPSAALHFSQTGSGLKLQLDLTISSRIDRAAIERELLRAILLEMIYRNESQISPGTAYVEPPDWLVEGMLTLSPGRDRAPLMDALAVSDEIMPLDEFLGQSRILPGLDSPARLLYGAYSFALVRLLVDETDGRARLARYIDNLARGPGDPIADLKAQFPQLSGDDAGKIWKSNIAGMIAAQNYRLLTFAETDRKLDELLCKKFSDSSRTKRTLQLEDFTGVKPSSAQEMSLKRLSGDLLLLAARANPVLRPTVQEYQQIAAQLAAGKVRGVSERLARVKAGRAKIAARMSDIDDYMNWCEATKMKTPSGVFADYLKAASNGSGVKSHRQDALSVYLDAVEQQF